MVTICGVAEDEGAKQMTAALIKWPLMKAAMKQVRYCCVCMHVCVRALCRCVVGPAACLH